MRLLLILLLALPLHAAINAASQWEIRTTGLSTNGGCWYNAGGSSTDYSQQDAPQLSLTDVTSNAAGTAWASVTGGFTANMVGNCVRLTSGTNFTVGTYQITAFTDTNNVTVDRDSTSGASASAGNINVGGGLIDTWTVAPAYVAGNTVWIKGGTFTRTSTLFAITVQGTSTAPVTIQGYTTTHGDSTGTSASWTGPIFTSATNSIALWTLNNADFYRIVGIKFTHTAATRGICLSAVTANSSPVLVGSSVFDGCSTAISGSNLLQYLTVDNTYITNSTTNAISQGNYANYNTITGSIFTSNTGAAFTQGGSGVGAAIVWTNNVAAGNTYGIRSTAAAGINFIMVVDGSVFDSNTDSGILTASTTTPERLQLTNNIFWNNTTNGISLGMAVDVASLVNRNNAYGSNGTDRTNIAAGTSDVTLTGSPFVSATNWALNNTAGAGAACRAAGFPGTMIDGVTIGYRDIGAVQHQDTGGAVTRAYPFVM